MFKIKNAMNLILPIVLLAAIVFLYNRYSDKLERENNTENYGAIHKYLLTDPSLVDSKNKKPIIWIPIKYEYNSRDWLSFGSRSSTNLNQPYMYLTVRSIINQCEDSFHICLIDDSSFEKLLPNWSINMKTISSPVLDYIRQLGMAKILYMYGGIICPPSFLCMQNLSEMYRIGTANHKMFICENIDRNITSTTKEFYPDVRFMGAQKENHIVEQLIAFMERTISSDYTSQAEFLGEINRWTEARVRKQKINLIEGKMIGVKTMDDTPILIDHLLSNQYIDLYPKTYGIYIPADEILSRRHYEWFARLSPKQVLESKVILSKYILLASTPDSKMGVIEPMKAKDKAFIRENVGYWKTDLDAPVWGLRPLMTNDKAHPLAKEPHFNG
uniref:Uncharacterized protein n=1 Tax=viral metagenome TaxID=1070528 RepID=A0A6C0EVW7_9ZZZZ